jgi:hypothetical protein
MNKDFKITNALSDIAYSVCSILIYIKSYKKDIENYKQGQTTSVSSFIIYDYNIINSRLRDLCDR